METVLEYRSGRIAASLERSEKTLVSGVQFTLSGGESLAIIGETGSGKTMTALSIMGLLPSNVQMQGGSIQFLGQPMPAKMQQILGVELVYIPQSGLECLNPSRRIRHHLYDNLKKLGIPRGQQEAAAIQKLRLAGLEEPEKLLDAYPFQLSGGMAQRVTIAISACSRAKLVIADEPTNGLDYEAKLAFQKLLRTLFPEAALLVITHDITVASFCDRILVLCGGKMMETGSSRAVLTDPRQPYTQALRNALVENGMAESPVLREGQAECPFYRRCPQAAQSCIGVQVCHTLPGRAWWCR